MQVQLNMRSIFDKNLLENNVKARKKTEKTNFLAGTGETDAMT